MKSLLFRRFN